jgi:hypothetical protein
MNPKSFYLDIPVWRSGCWIVWTASRQQAENWINTKFPSNDPHEIPSLDTAHAVTLDFNPIFIFLTEWKFDAENVSVLTHECIHVANHILNRCGVKEREYNDESLAYLVGHLVESFLRELTKSKIK